jgi:hypothetical protein
MIDLSSPDEVFLKQWDKIVRKPFHLINTQRDAWGKKLSSHQTEHK